MHQSELGVWPWGTRVFFTTEVNIVLVQISPRLMVVLETTKALKSYQYVYRAATVDSSPILIKDQI